MMTQDERQLVESAQRLADRCADAADRAFPDNDPLRRIAMLSAGMVEAGRELRAVALDGTINDRQRILRAGAIMERLGERSRGYLDQEITT